MRIKNIVTFSLCLGLLFLGACQKRSQGDFHLIRLMDQLQTSGVRRSPLAAMTQAERDLYSPLESFPLKELGTGDNPYGIKKKLSLGVMELDLLFAPPHSEYSLSLKIPEGAVLEFWTGVLRDSGFESLAAPFPAIAEGVNFRVRVEVGHSKKELFQKFVAMPPLKPERTMNLTMHRVQLPQVRGQARITLITEGQGRALALWHNPIIYSPGRRPRGVILISVDTLRADHLQTYGYRRPTSPNLDKLAADGVVFERVYSSAPWTLPAHVSLLTSLFDIDHGIYVSDDRMDDSLVTLAEVLKQNQFVTSAVTGGGFLSRIYGFSRGFDTYKEGDGGIEYNNSAELVAHTAAQWIESNKDKSFFLFLHTYQVHAPYDTPPPYNTVFLDRDAVWKTADTTKLFDGKQAIFKQLPDFQRRNLVALYDAEIRYTDEALLKTVVDKLKALDLYDEAMIIVTSDHGEEFFEHGAWEHGAHVYDESIRVPLVIKFPRSRFHGQRVESIVRNVDVMPTVLEQMGIQAGNLALDGQSLLPLASGGKRKDRPFVSDTNWMFMEGWDKTPERNAPHGIAANEGRYKIILNRNLSPKERASYDPPVPVRPAAELYDLEADPGEKTDLAARRAELANTMARELRARYAGARKTRPAKAKLTKELEEQLRALGYIR